MHTKMCARWRCKKRAGTKVVPVRWMQCERTARPTDPPATDSANPFHLRTSTTVRKQARAQARTLDEGQRAIASCRQGR
jgi:hypothetical protein